MTGPVTASAVDAVIVGAGPNGLSAAITLAQAGLEVAVYEAAGTVGGGARTEELTRPGFRHDPCSAVHPLGAGFPGAAILAADRTRPDLDPAGPAAGPPLPGRPRR